MPRPAKNPVFPQYLDPSPENDYRPAVRTALVALRGKRAEKEVAKSAGVSVTEVQAIESKECPLGVSLGSLRHVVKYGYGGDLLEMLKQLHDEKFGEHGQNGRSPFDRECYYSYVRQAYAEHPLTPVLYGGDFRRFIWAIPLRRLLGQPLLTEILELAPRRRKDGGGGFPEHRHGGTEVIHVVFGEIAVHILDAPMIELKGGTFIHFNGRQPHYVRNASPNSPALMMVTRTMEP